MVRGFSLLPVALAGSSATPNILFILTDDMGWGDVSYNTEHVQPGAGGTKWTVNPPRTPNIDELALSDGTMLFRRFYSASAVCSPTRASILSGRTPMRSCINGAEGCGSSPAWSCYGEMPFPPTEFTVAEAVKEKAYATAFIGKWHLGDFWVKDGHPKNYATAKWPSSHPGMHGFDEWMATEASAPSSTPNCACMPEWIQEGQGCIHSGGKWAHSAPHECSNYWSPTDLDKHHVPTGAECRTTDTSLRHCVGNLTTKIEGDDSQYMMDVFEDFLQRKSPTGPEASAWLVQLSMHTNHDPHPAMPEWYNAYTEAEGGPAGDYLGTISQMDAALGRVVGMLKKYGHYDNTMIWYTHDNGAHAKRRPSGQLSAANGLRQCKASLFEGGIRVGGFVHWPAVIKKHVSTLHAAVTSDFLPTVLDLLQIKHPQPSWAMDGMSLLPLLQGDVASTTPREKPLGFKLNKQVAWQEDAGDEGVWKIIANPKKGQCDDFSEPYGSMKDLRGPFLFNLTADPSESEDLCSKFSDRCDRMFQAMKSFEDSIDFSQGQESQCAKASPSPSPSPSPTPSPAPSPSPGPAPVPSGGFALQSDGKCLTLDMLEKHGILELASCDAGSRWDDSQGYFTNIAADNMCLKLDSADRKPCSEGNTIWIGSCASTDPGFHLNDQGRLVTDKCPGMCGVPATEDAVFAWTSDAVALGDCSAADAFTFTRTASLLTV